MKRRVICDTCNTKKRNSPGKSRAAFAMKKGGIEEYG